MFDYVIVGGGSAGCVMANRLSAGGEFKVCLLEAGPPDDSPFIPMPGGVLALLRSKVYNWQFWTLPQPRMGNRPLFWPRGRTLGGSSSINAQVCIRGHAWDYDRWAELGNEGWAWRDVLPLFKALENYEPGADEAGGLLPGMEAFHGRGGPLNVASLRDTNPMSQVFVDAARQAGHAPNDDFNGATQEGVGFYKVYQKDGQRCSNARAYLREAQKRPNLTVITHAQATRVVFDHGRAAGVRYVYGGKEHEVAAKREVILSAGTVGSPQLLLLSGIGPAVELARHGIAQQHELPGVGQNLQDHLDAYVVMRAKTRLGMSFHPSSLLRTIKALLQYLFGRRGPLTSNIAEAGGFARSHPAEPVPDLQFHFAPLVNVRHGLDLWPAFRWYGHTLMTCDLRPLSRGELRLASADPLAPPAIDPKHFEQERDLDKLVTGLKKAREIFAQPAFAPHNLEEMEPGPAVRSDAEIREWIRGHAETLYHPVGTCKMGSDPMAVVDARLRVHGVTGLRVVDASIMPTLVGGNTNGPSTMIGERGARLVLEDIARAQAESAGKASGAAAPEAMAEAVE
ncbi:MAG TPA: GMC family oxidoreductase N-terminal domain-containing protein [Solimonas sp.]|nr:GMC family oxidoreductase N-terminal domain-containing protein [Solimonas sp.]